jgi:hypothetical protein
MSKQQPISRTGALVVKAAESLPARVRSKNADPRPTPTPADRRLAAAVVRQKAAG